MDGDPEKLRRTAVDVEQTQPIDEGSLRRARMLGELNEGFADKLAGKSISYGGNEYEFLQVILKDDSKEFPEPGDFALVLRQKDTEIVTEVDPDTFSKSFTVS